MVSKHVVPGTIYVDKSAASRPIREVISFTVIGHSKVFIFMNDNYLRVSCVGDYVASSFEEILDDADKISYLRAKAQRILGDLIQECEEGIFDD